MKGRMPSSFGRNIALAGSAALATESPPETATTSHRSVAEFAHERNNRVGDQIWPLLHHEMPEVRQFHQGHPFRVIGFK